MSSRLRITTLQYDSNDVVAIIRNVTPQASGPTIGIVNHGGLPFSDRVIFNRIQNQDPTLGDIFHDTLDDQHHQ